MKRIRFLVIGITRREGDWEGKKFMCIDIYKYRIYEFKVVRRVKGVRG